MDGDGKVYCFDLLEGAPYEVCPCCDCSRHIWETQTWLDKNIYNLWWGFTFLWSCFLIYEHYHDPVAFPTLIDPNCPWIWQEGWKDYIEAAKEVAKAKKK